MILPKLKDENDLISRLKIATKTKSEGLNPEDFTPEVEVQTESTNIFTASQEPAATPRPKPDQSDFEPLTQPEPIAEFEEPKQAAEPVTLEDATRRATTYVDLFDNLNMLLLPKLYEKKIFTNPLDKTRADQINKASRESRETELSDNDLKIIAKVEMIIAYVRKLPLSEQEKKSLIEPLADLLKETNSKPSPVWALIIAAVVVTLPRLLPFLNINFDLFNVSDLMQKAS